MKSHSLISWMFPHHDRCGLFELQYCSQDIALGNVCLNDTWSDCGNDQDQESFKSQIQQWI